MSNPTPTASETDAQALALVQDAFHQARSGNTAMLQELLDIGMPVDVCNENGDSLLMLASYHGHLDATRLLLQRGADPEQRNGRGQSPLDGAAFKGNLEMVAQLLAGGADVNGRARDGKTPLMYAAMFDRVVILDFLISQGADVKRQDSSGLAAIDLARTFGAQHAVAELTRLAA